MKQADSINRKKRVIDRFELIAINMKQTVSINGNKREIDRFN